MSHEPQVPGKVALFFGWADSPVWYRTPDEFGPVDLETLPLSPGLRERLYSWNEHADSVLSEHEFQWPDRATEEHFRTAGSRLAHELRSELGIEVIYNPDGDRDVRSQPTSTQQRMTGSWTAYAPLSGSTYRPYRPSQ